MTILKYKLFWIFILLLFLYNTKRFDIDENWKMRYNQIITVDEILKR